MKVYYLYQENQFTNAFFLRNTQSNILDYEIPQNLNFLGNLTFTQKSRGAPLNHKQSSNAIEKKHVHLCKSSYCFNTEILELKSKYLSPVQEELIEKIKICKEVNLEWLLPLIQTEYILFKKKFLKIFN
ncbi:unnamed protein product (macronuclear) [Paramecium tetraurelia]|uniref:DUF1524 domain-containing protein n=1 Tax=Paramecium tetraurelia TaxID=5888 RepID=A0C003_PARTE|nr:uncharacterized protein GSPATT00005973001 [Paramecium tetraurelia]CAK64120.1 unnamed protein product [Paramecium tetraurelia]|eukprot:XP_001431518.1 hypothetical protein (macronuclear) [Paramecium tetraurelia strain d4-2]